MQRLNERLIHHDFPVFEPLNPVIRVLRTAIQERANHVCIHGKYKARSFRIQVELKKSLSYRLRNETMAYKAYSSLPRFERARHERERTK